MPGQQLDGSRDAFVDGQPRRKAAWTKPLPKVTKGYLVRYANSVTSANTGAIVK